MARPLSPLPLNGPAISGGNLFAASLIEADTFCLASFEIKIRVRKGKRTKLILGTFMHISLNKNYEIYIENIILIMIR